MSLSTNFSVWLTCSLFTGPVFFRVVLGDNVEMVTAQLDDSLARFFQRLQDDVDAARHIPLKVSYTACKFYQMRNPVSVWMADSNDFEDEDKDEGGSNSADQDNWDDFLAQARQACLEETNRVLVNPRTTKVRSLAERFSAEDIYLAIEFPDRKYHQFSGSGCFVSLIALLQYSERQIKQLGS